MSRSLILATAVLAAAAAIPATSQAAQVNRQLGMMANATANCQGALPAFETAIRKRPLAVINEGTSASFVTCSFVKEFNDEIETLGVTSYFGAFFTNRTSAGVTVSCTGVAGFETNASNTFVNKQVTVAANSSAQAQLFFLPVDNNGNGYHPLVSISCNLPAGVGINDTWIGYVLEDDIGTN